MKTLVKSCMSKYWETFELLLDEKTIQGVNELVAVRTNGTAPVLTKEEIMQCYREKKSQNTLKRNMSAMSTIVIKCRFATL